MGTRNPQLDLPLEFQADGRVARAHIRLGDRLVSYILKHSRNRRSITLMIDDQGLRVGAPWQASQRAIDNQLRKHEAWVLRKLAEWQARRAPPRRWRDGETLMLLGEPLRLTLTPAPRATDKDGDRLLVGIAPPLRPEAIASEVAAWLKAQAFVCFHARVARYLPSLVVPAPEVRLSDARTRWGSCHPAGRIHLNWCLVQMPLRLVDYVIVHELAHLREMNHSPRFWQTVARVLPDYAARKAEIRTEGYSYLLA